LRGSLGDRGNLVGKNLAGIKERSPHFAYKDVDEGREQDAEASFVMTAIIIFPGFCYFE
jgi:hypothetical protein